jgi:hypothetical protein
MCVPPGWEFDARPRTLLCKKIIVAKSKEVETGPSISLEQTNLAVLREVMAQKEAVFPVVLIIMMMLLMRERERVRACVRVCVCNTVL